MSKQPLLADFKQIAKQHNLKLVIEQPSTSPLLAIVNLEKRSLTVVSRDLFCKKHAITWTEDVLKASTPTTEEEKKALHQAKNCWKALLQTDRGLGVTNLQTIQQGDYVGLYEGSFVDQKYNPNDPDYFRQYFKTFADETYLIGFTPTGASWQSGLITAKDFRGFGGFLQHFPDEDEVKAYFVSSEFKEKFSVENLLRVNLGNRVFFKAKTDIPPLSHLGFSYRSYWCGRDESPVLFNQQTGMSIPTTHYQILRYYVEFVDTQTGEEHCQGFSIQNLQSLNTRGEYSTIGNLIYKPEHLKPIRDSKTGKIKPKSMYSLVLIDGLTTKDYLTVADGYFVENDPSDIYVIEHVETVIHLYQSAEKLFLQEKNSTQSADCQKRIQFYQKHLQRLKEPDRLDSEAKQLLEKYTLKDEKTSTDKHLAFRRAAALGHLDDLKKLLFLGANINLQGSGSGKTALHHAAIGDHFNIFMFLLSIKADVNIRDSNHKLVFDYVKSGSSLYKALGESFTTHAETPLSLKLTPPSFT